MKTEQQINEEAIALYGSASPELKKILEKQFEPGFFAQENKSIESVLEFLGITKDQALEKKILLFEKPQSKRERYLNATSLLPLIAEKINGDWEADFENTDQYKWQPYFEKNKVSGWIASGLAHYFPYTSFAGVGFYETEEKAVNAGKQFLHLYVDILNYVTK